MADDSISKQAFEDNVEKWKEKETPEWCGLEEWGEQTQTGDLNRKRQMSVNERNGNKFGNDHQKMASTPNKALDMWMGFIIK